MSDPDDRDEAEETPDTVVLEVQDSYTFVD